MTIQPCQYGLKAWNKSFGSMDSGQKKVSPNVKDLKVLLARQILLMLVHAYLPTQFLFAEVALYHIKG